MMTHFNDNHLVASRDIAQTKTVTAERRRRRTYGMSAWAAVGARATIVNENRFVRAGGGEC